MDFYKSSWHGSTDKDDQSGIATFSLSSVTYTMPLRSFKDFQTIEVMLRIMYKHGKHTSVEKMRTKMNDVLAKLGHD